MKTRLRTQPDDEAGYFMRLEPVGRSKGSGFRPRLNVAGHPLSFISVAIAHSATALTKYDVQSVSSAMDLSQSQRMFRRGMKR